MKLVLRYENGSHYLYRESEEHHQVMQNKIRADGGRSDMKRLDSSILDEDCCLDLYAYDNPYYMVFDLKEN